MTIIDIGFDENHDMYISGSDIAFTDENDGLVQKLIIRLQFLFEEWFLDNTKGIPYTQFIFEKGSSIEDIYSIFRQEIKDTEGVENIVSLELFPNADSRGMRVDFSVNDGLSTGSVEVNI